MFPLEAVSKRAVIASLAALIALQASVHPDMTWLMRAVVAVAFVAGWLAARSGNDRAVATWLLLAPLFPAIGTLATGRLGEPMLDLPWMAGLAGSLVRTTSSSRWSLPPTWRLLLGGWALVIVAVWPVMVAREAGFEWSGLRDVGMITSWARLSAPHVIAWTLYVALTQLLALLALDHVFDRISARPGMLPAAVHGLWIGVTIASIVAAWQGIVDIGFLNTEYWAERQRAGGTMLNPNAYGVAAAFAGPIGFLALRAWRPQAWALAGGVLLINWLGVWMSGSRTTLVCALAGGVGLALGLWHARANVRGRLAVAAAAAVVIVTAATLGESVGPLRRLSEGSIASEGIVGLWNRAPYGPIALQMLREYPLTGVGVGAYHYLAPDYERVAHDERLEFDNAQNWWRHQAAELGVLGAAFVIAWSALVAWRAFTARARPEAYLLATVARSLVIALGAMSLVGMPTQDPRVLLFFLAAIALLASTTTPAVAEATPRWTRGAALLGLVLALGVAAGHLWLARGELSVAERAARTRRPYVAGAYPLEEPSGGAPFYWTDDESRFVWPAENRWLVLSLWAHHPDLEGSPVEVTVSTPCGELFRHALTDTSPIHVAVRIPDDVPSVDTTVSVSRTWRPSEHGSEDARTLGAAVSPRFVSAEDELDSAVRTEWPVCQAGR